MDDPRIIAICLYPRYSRFSGRSQAVIGCTRHVRHDDGSLTIDQIDTDRYLRHRDDLPDAHPADQHGDPPARHSGAPQPRHGQAAHEAVIDLAIPLPPQRPPGSCHMVGALPDPIATPGCLNPAVRVSTIAATIAVPGWTAIVRPPVAYTNALKERQMVEYGLTGDPADFEEDHLVPLCCGGHPTSAKNLWPQRRTGLMGARTKDMTEVAALHAILKGLMSLADVQAGFMADWVALHGRLFSNKALMGMMMAMEEPEDEP